MGSEPTIISRFRHNYEEQEIGGDKNTLSPNGDKIAEEVIAEDLIRNFSI